jgi:glycosyltransferase involved in cell wall biosynthesis
MFFYYQFGIVDFAFAAGLGSLIIIQLMYYIIVYGKIAFYKGNKKENKDILSVSVVLCVKDEAYNLEKHLPIILEQEYPNFEVVVVNDASTDETEYILKLLQEIYPNLSVVHLYENINKYLGKKYPLSLGIKSARNEIILLTDADTIPLGYNWISEMVKSFFDKKQIVLGFSRHQIKKGFLNSLIHYDSQVTAMNYLGLALIGKPYMGTGKNLAYSRKMFFKEGGFISQYNISVGDDDLFINKVATKQNTSVSINEKSINISSPKETFSEWILKKKKQYISRRYFQLKDKLTTLILPLTTLFLYTLAIISLIFGFPWEYVVLGLIIKFTIQIIYYYRSSKTLGTKKIAIFAPLFEILFLFLNTIIQINTLMTKKR